MHFDYFNESLMFGKDMIGSMGVRVSRSEPVRCDREAASTPCSPTPTPRRRPATERDWIKHLIAQIGDMSMIVISVTLAVFFTMLLVTANRMAQSVRERTNEIGVLKTLGFGATRDRDRWCCSSRCC